MLFLLFSDKLAFPNFLHQWEPRSSQVSYSSILARNQHNCTGYNNSLENLHSFTLVSNAFPPQHELLPEVQGKNLGLVLIKFFLID